MWEPVGPLPAAVYWRRRGAMLAAAAALVGLVVATAAGDPGITAVPAANRTAADTGTATAPATAPGGPAAGGPALGSTPADTARVEGAPASDSPRGTAPPDAARGGAPAPAGERIRPDEPSRPAAPVPVPPSGPVACTNAMLAAAAELDHAVHRVGSRPVLRLVLTNTSGQACVRDLDAARQEIVVWSADGATRLWSSNDCANAPTVDLRTLLPGRPVAFAVTWGERTTTPGCRQPRTVVPAGTYRLLVRLDDLISPPTPFIRTP